MGITSLPPLVQHATVADLYREEGKAELVGGRVLRLPLDGRSVAYAQGEMMYSLRIYQSEKRLPGIVTVACVAYVVDLPNRQSFSPDAGYYVGANSGMRFFDGAPVFAVEVRSEGDYGPAAETAITQKRRDYFAAGTLVVWDVDLLGDDVIRKYTQDSGAETPAFIFRRGDAADAEPAVPGWTLPVDDLYEP